MNSTKFFVILIASGELVRTASHASRTDSKELPRSETLRKVLIEQRLLPDAILPLEQTNLIQS